jgi:hypothetical protein
VRLIVNIPKEIKKTLDRHLFQNRLEQGSFLFSVYKESLGEMVFDVTDQYLVPKEGWQIQSTMHLELKDTERAKIMKIARDRKCALIDCHSHVQLGRYAAFSPSDMAGITEFSGYVKWKLDGRPYIAMAFNETSVDAVGWIGAFDNPYRVNEIRIVSNGTKLIIPRYTWLEGIKYFKEEDKYASRSKRKTNTFFGRRGSEKN